MELKTNPSPRIPLQVDVEYRRSYGRNVIVGTLKNISLTGAFLEVDNGADLLPEDKLIVTLNVSGRERQINAAIIWKNQNGCGVKFLPFNNRDVQIVDDLMYFAESSRDTKRDLLSKIFSKVS